MEFKAGWRVFWRARQRRHARSLIAQICGGLLVVGSVLTFSVNGTVAASTQKSLREYQQPLVVADSFGLTTYEIDDPTVSQNFANIPNVVGVAMTSERSLFVATSTTLQRLRANGEVDNSFASTGTLTGFSSITRMAIDEEKEMIYVLHSSVDQDSTIISINFAGEVLATAGAPGAVAIVASHGHVAAFTPTLENSQLFSTDLSTQATLNLDLSLSPAVDVRDASVISDSGSSSSADAAAFFDVIVADQGGNTVLRTRIIDADTQTPLIALSSSTNAGDSIALQQPRFISAASDGSFIVRLGGSRAGDVVRVANDNTISETTFGAAHATIGAMVLAPTASQSAQEEQSVTVDQQVPAPATESASASSRSMSMSMTASIAACPTPTPTPASTRFSKFVFTSVELCEFTGLPTGVTSIDILVVGGGGGGGENVGQGGSGGGGYYAGNVAVTPSTALTIRVGEGGRGGSSSFSSTTVDALRNGADGGTTTLSWGSNTFTAPGGQGGHTAWSNDRCDGTGWYTTQPVASTGTGSGGTGQTGGQGGLSDSNSTSTNAGSAGGDGFINGISGTTLRYGGGGGGAGWGNSGNAGGLGGGGAGAGGAGVAGTPGTANTGGGGGGGGVSCAAGGRGGDGVVIIRYANVPTITTQPTSRTVAANATTTLSVTASAVGADSTQVSYQWRKDGVNIAGANSRNFAIASAQSTDAGSYDVIVTNTLNGFASSSVTSTAATLTVSAPPCTPTQSTSGRYVIQKFINTTASCDYDALPAHVTNIDVLVVGGGGGGGGGNGATGTSTGGGGGGAARFVTDIPTTSGSRWIVQVGAGGSNGVGTTSGSETSGGNGGSSSFGDITAGGGEGALRRTSGGTRGVGGTASGSGAVNGGDGGTFGGGAGGIGNSFSITGTNICYGAGGGGGNGSGNGGTGGCGVTPTTDTSHLGRGTAGGNSVASWLGAQAASNSSQNSGDIYRGHGGGGATVSSSGGTGGPGVVYVRYIAVPTVSAPSASTTQVGQDAMFSVTASAGAITTGGLTYQWRKDGVDISGATGSSLTVSAVDFDDAGSYDVVVTNNDGSGKSASTTSSAATLTVDEVAGAPNLSFSQNPTSPTNSTTQTFTLTANESISGLAASDITNVGTATGCVIAVSGTQPGTSFEVTVSSCSEGTVQLRVAADSVSDRAGITGPPSVVNSTAVTIDRTVPTASFTTVPSGTLTSASSTFTVTFSEAISGLAATDFSNAGTAQNCVFTPAASTGTAINVSVSSCSGGTLELQLAANAVVDAAGNTGPASAVTAASLTVESNTRNFKIKSLTVSTTARTVVDINSFTGDDRGGMAISNASVFLVGDQGMAYANKALTSLNSTTRYTEVDAIVSDLKTMKAYAFNLGNTSNCAPVASPCFTQLIELNQTTGAKPSSPTIITLSSPIPYGAGGQVFAGYGRIVFRHHSSQIVYNIDMPSGVVTTAGTVSISPMGSEQFGWGSSTYPTWGVVEYFDGDLWLAYAVSGFIRRTNVRTGLSENIVTCNCSDLASFVVDPTNNRWYFHYEGSSSSFNTFINENLGFAAAEFETVPSATITPTSSLTNATSTTFDVLFDDAVTGVTASDFSVSGTSPNWSVSSVTANSATSYTVTVTQSSPGSGTLILNLASGAALWTAGGGTAIPSGEVSSTAVTIDQTVPTASFTTVPSGALSSASSTFTVTFSEAISGLTASDFSNAGTAQNCVFTPASSTGTAINVTVAGCGDGTLELQLAANAVVDAAGNTGPTNAVTAASRYVDGFPGAPTASFTSAPTSPSNSQTLTFGISFNEPISGFTDTDITNIGTATGCEYTINGTQPGNLFTIDVENCSDGTVMLRINNGSVSDRSGTLGPGSAGTENSFSATLTGVSVNMYSAVHPDGSKLYVASEGNARVNVVDTQTNSITHNITVGAAPRGIAVSPDGNHVYVANYTSNTVSKISTATNSVVATITVGRNPNGLAITPDGTKVVVANISSSSLSIINTETNIASSTVNLGRSPWNVVVSPDSRTAYSANYTNNTVSVVNLTNNTVTSHVNVGSNPYELTVNKSGSRVYASNYSSSTVSVIDTDTRQVVRTVSGLTRPMGIATSIDDQTVYVNSYTNNRLYWFDANTFAVNSSSIATGLYPWGLTLAPDGAHGYVNNRSGSSVTKFNAQGYVQSQSVTRDVNAPTLTSFTANTNSPNDLNEQTWTLVFSENVTDLTAADFTVGGTSPDWGSITVSGSGSTYTVSVQNTSPTNGTIAVELATDAVTDASGNTGPSASVVSPTMRWAVGQGVFKIDSLTTSNVNAVDINATVGDDRGGIALTSDKVLVNGDSALGRFDINNLGSAARVSSQVSTWTDAVVTDVKTLKSYAFNLNSSRTGSLSTLTLLDSATGALSSTVLALSSAIPIGGTSALFSGYSRVAVVTGGKFYDISLPSGQVTNYGDFTMPSRVSSENWATWGVVEYFSGQLHLVYVQNSTTIARINVATREVTTVASAAAGFSDMASFTVHPRANRWYFRFEGRAGAFNFGSSETVGYANASFNVGGVAPEPITNVQLSTRSSTAVVTWSAPTEGPTPTDYVLQYSRDGGATWVWVNDGISTSTTASVSGFAPGDVVRFRVATVSEVNASPFVSSADDTVSPYPTAPTITSITTANASLSVNFTAPSSRGASAINTYQYSLDGGTTWLARTPSSSSSPLVISGLTNGTQYPVIIRAVNTQGAGESSNSVSATPFTTPDAPTITSVMPTASGTLTVEFTAPSSDGGNVITNYQYSINNGATWITRSPASTSTNFVITGLANGSSYTIVLRAVNARGSGTISTPIVATAGVPATAPTITNLTTGDGSVNVTFSAPSYNGGLPITNYEYSFDGTNWTTRTPASTASPLTITGLTNGSSYTVRIRAVNLAGIGASSATRTGTPSRAPDAPAITAIESSSQRLRVSVDAPQFDGGTPITNYQYSTNNGLTWTTLSPVNVTGVFTITGLNNAVTYQVRVRAVNARGSGDSSVAVEGTPATTPGSPTITTITPSPQTLTVAFTPGSTGGAAPSNYEYSTDDGTTWTAASPSTTTSPLTITGLANGTTYAVRIRAVNSQGAGGASAAMDATPATTPSAPTITSISGSNSRISVVVTDGFNGGAPITNYQYSTDNGTTWTTRVPASAASPIIIAGLTNGTDYDVKVRAINAQGIGTDSSSQIGRPATVPDAPIITSLSPDPGQLTVAFTPPSFDGGNTITNYQYSVDGGTTWTTRSPSDTTSPITIVGLEDGTTYAVRIRAVNAQGSGLSSVAVEGVPENVPGAPTITNIVSANQALRVEFSPSAPRGLSVTNYEYSLDNGDNWTTLNPASTQSPILIESLTNGTTYQVKVRGVNSRGSGLASVAVDAIPSTPPSAPIITSVVGGMRGDDTLVGSGTLEISFTSGATGGAPITATEYSLNGGTSWTRASQATSPISISELTNGVTYNVRLRHVNVRGAGVSSQSSSGVPSTTPGAPVLRSIRGSDRTLTLYVTAPSVVGGSTITNYEYFLDNGEAGTWVALSPPSTAMPIVITQFLSEDDGTPVLLENGATYGVTVRAVNANGPGESSETRSAKPSTIPGAPTITSVTGSNGQLTVNFAAPTNNGGEEVTNYEYSTDGGQTWSTRSPISAESPLVITGLSNGTDYSVKVRGVNIQGSGADSNAMTGRPAAPPSAPTINSVVSGNGSLSVVFTQGFDGGASVSNVEYSTNNGTDWVTPSPVSTSSPVTIGGLTNGSTYQVKIRLVNSKGSGVESTATTAIPATVPDAPTITSVTPGDRSLALTVGAPSSNGGSQITAYQYSTDNGETWTSTDSTSTNITVASLVNGSAYQLKVRATNRMGFGAASIATTATPSRVADAPTISSISAGNQKLTVVFTEGFNGGNATTNVQYSVNNGQTWSTRSLASTTSPLVISGLTNGTIYSVKLRMVNERGEGLASVAVAATPATTPGAPTISSIDVDSRKLTVNVTAPNDNGGSDIVNYEYSLDGGASWIDENTAVGTGSFEIDPLTNGTTYAVTVRAVNAYGSGTPSATVFGTPATTPSMPVILSSTPLNEAVSLGFALGPSGGSTITNIEYSIDNGSTWTTRAPASTASPILIENLQNGVTYDIKVRAINARGSGVPSRASGTPATTPGAPLITRIAPRDSSLVVEFEPPEDNGGALVTNYEYSLNNGVWVTRSPIAESSPLVIAGLTNGTSYSVRLRAVNDQGSGETSSAVAQSPARVPDAPTIAGSTVTDSEINIGYTVSDDGGRTVSAIDYSLDNGESWTTVLAPTSSITVQSLTNGTTYSVKLRARNQLGTGPESSVAELTPARAPDAPTISSITRGDTTLTVAYTLGGNGGNAINDVEYTIDDGVTWVTQASPSAQSPLRIQGLTNGVSYTVKIRAVNSQGSGVDSLAMTGMPAGAPSAPTLSSVSRGNTSADVAFTFGSNNGATISNIEYSTDNGVTWMTRSPASTVSPLSITGLVNGTTYNVRVRALNAMGISPTSNSLAVTPAAPPAAPTITSVVGEDSRAVVSFMPNGDGGDPITNYAYSIDNGATWTSLNPQSTQSPLVIPGLTNGTEYSIRLRAINSISESSESSAVQTTPSGPPLAPTITSVDGSDETLTISFSAGGNGGAAISGYQISTDGGSTWTNATSVTSPVSISGLTNGAQYVVALRALNNRGIGATSSTMTGIPATVPDAPQITEVISDDGAVHLAIAFGGNGGNAINNIEYSTDNGTTWVTPTPASTSRPLTIDNLINGTTYNVRVRTVNNIGASEPSGVVPALPATTPGAPTVLSKTSGNGTLLVNFTAPESNGGAPITHYQYSLDGGGTWVDTPDATSPIEISNVTVGTSYEVDLRAVNFRGAGADTQSAAKLVTAPPAPPTITTTETGDGEIALRYAPPTDTGGTTIDTYYYSLDGGENWEMASQQVATPSTFAATFFSTRYQSASRSTNAQSFNSSATSVQSLRITGLINGVTYNVTVRAAHSEALGLPSSSFQLIPSTTPSVVPNVTAQSSDQSLTISYDEPSDDGGRTISGYEFSLDGGSTWSDVPENPFMISGLENGQEYDVRVRALNGNGFGIASASLMAVPSTTASAPGTPVATAGIRVAELTWTAPEDDGGSSIFDYVIQYSINDGVTWQDVEDTVSTATNVLVSSLVGGQTYLFRVIPVNLAGRGDPSLASSPITPASPAAVIEEPASTPVAQPIQDNSTKLNNKSTGSASSKNAEETNDGVFTDDNSVSEDSTQSPDMPTSPQITDNQLNTDDEPNSITVLLTTLAIFAMLGVLGIGLAGFGFNAGPSATIARRIRTRLKTKKKS